jgi:predicted metal-dependent hydrolase
MQKDFNYESRRKNLFEERAQKDLGSEELQWSCRSVLGEAFPAFRGVEIDACFYPYVGLTHTLRRKKNGWVLRISDHCRYAPPKVLKSIVLILAYKVMRRKPPRRYIQTYELFRKDPEIKELVRNRRAAKGRKQFSDKPGRHHSLRKIFRDLNEKYFNNQIEIKKIGWGLRRGWDRVGHYDPIHHTITLSPVLDSPDVPSYVVRYIVYHEMLHALFGDIKVHGFRKHHPREFRNTENAYPDSEKAKKFLGKFSRRIKQAF